MTLTPAEIGYAIEAATARPSLDEREHLAQVIFRKLYQRSYALAPWMLKSNLFSAASGPRVEYIDEHELPAHPGYTVKYQGPELRQDDERVLLAMLKLAAGQSVHISLRIAPRPFCRQLGWSEGSDSVAKLLACVRRLHAARVQVCRDGGAEDGYSFVSDYKHQRGELTVWLSQRLVDLYRGSLTYLDVDTRLAVRDGLASWLYGYVRADACAAPIQLPMLLAMSGLWNYEQKEFNRQLRKALDELKELGAVEDWSMSGTTLRVRKPTKH